MSFKKLALIVVGILAAALLWTILNGSLANILNALWTWIFTTMNATNPPPAPF